MKKIKKFFSSYLDDLLYFAGAACVAVGCFKSPFPFLGWIAIGAALIVSAWFYGVAS